MPAYDFVTVDVFTTERFRGNPLAVFTDARGLGDATMQAIAAEFGYSEITFVLPPEDAQNDARVRIFTPTTEIPFAGHPNVGTAYVLGRLPSLFGKPVGKTLRFEELAGLVTIDLRHEGDAVTGATIRAPQALSVGETKPDTDLIARCASLTASDIVTTTHAPSFASVGLPFAVAELSGLEALAAASPNIAVFHEAVGRHRQAGADFSLFLYVRSVEDPWKIRARMFAPLDNIMEDPATGSASAALAAFLVQLTPGEDATQTIVIEQGVEMGRRSLITLDVVKKDGKVEDVRISGECVDVIKGAIEA